MPLACGSPPGPPANAAPAAPPPSASTTTPATSNLEGPLEAVFGPRAGLSVELPTASSWSAEDSERWLVLSHPASASKLALRTWRAARRVRVEECESQTRLWRPDVPVVEGDTVIDQRTLTSPSGFSGRMTALARATEGDAAIEGWVLAFGVTIGRCFAAVFQTRGAGPGAEAAVANRLATITDRVLTSVQEHGVDSRVLGPRR